MKPRGIIHEKSVAEGYAKKLVEQNVNTQLN